MLCSFLAFWLVEKLDSQSEWLQTLHDRVLIGYSEIFNQSECLQQMWTNVYNGKIAAAEWPDVWLKSSLILPQTFLSKVTFFKIAQNRLLPICTFCKKILCQYLSKLAQSCHTVVLRFIGINISSKPLEQHFSSSRKTKQKIVSLKSNSLPSRRKSKI